MPRIGTMKNLLEIWQYRELLYFFVWKDIKVKYKQTSVGIIWAIMQPLLGCGLFTIIFGKFANVPSDGLPYPLFYFAALISWTYFSTSLTMSANSIIGNTQLITKIYFPRVMLPASSVCAMLLDLSITLVLLMFLILFYGTPISINLVLLFFVMCILIWFTFSIGLLFSALVVRFRDIRYAIPFAIQVWLFASPIVYPLSIIPEKYKWLYFFNPLTGIIESSRSLISGGQIVWESLNWSIGITAVTFIIGFQYFRRTERWFADII